jgi:threonyl-tRNA synthetase
MKCLLLHARKYQIRITGLATRPLGVLPEPLKESFQNVDNAVVAFVTMEDGDTFEMASQASADIRMFAKEVGEQQIVLAPFAHLSNRLADSLSARKLFDEIQAKLTSDGLKTVRTHFGSDKDLLLEVFGHPGNIRFREYVT